jgi:hypothetical protein
MKNGALSMTPFFPRFNRRKGLIMRFVTRVVFLVVGTLVIVGIGFAQIPNAGFETWSNGNPDGWDTNNGLYTFVTQSSSAHAGSSAAQGGVVNMNGFNLGCTLITLDNNGVGFPVSQRFAEFRGFYQFNPVGGDVFYANYLAQVGTSGVGAAPFAEASAQTAWKEFVAPVIYPGSDVPDNGIIHFWISGVGGLPHVGSTFLVDDITLGSTSDVADRPNGIPKSFGLEQNYPNPFNPTTNIVYDIPTQSRVTLVLFDLTGRQVARVVDAIQPAGRYRALIDGSQLSSGVYLYRIQAGNFVQVRKCTLVK